MSFAASTSVFATSASRADRAPVFGRRSAIDKMTAADMQTRESQSLVIGTPETVTAAQLQRASAALMGCIANGS